MLFRLPPPLQDQVFSTVPRLTAVLAGFLFLMPWMLAAPPVMPCRSCATSQIRALASCRRCRTHLSIPAGLPLAFGLVLARVAGVFFFLPLPVRDATPALARAAFAMAAALALYPHWPVVDVRCNHWVLFVVWLAGEAALGLAAGLLVGFLAEALTLSAQLVGLQAGYGYASVVDPTTQADSDVLQVVPGSPAGCCSSHLAG